VEQIKPFQWKPLFTGIYVTEQKVSKSVLLSGFRFTRNCWLIGDTGYDIIEGKKVNFNTVGIYSGFLAKEKLEEYNPDYMFEKVVEFMPAQIVNNGDNGHA
jgi:phosphoglycolate phosphatase-like HAD superfamily hydrolase